jgi:NADP-dependent aldehyde dehydrogenase
MDLAAQRPDPIPCFAEMSSTNPVFILPGALRDRGAQIAAGLHGSFTLGGGQFCTKPGLVFVPQHEQADSFLAELRRLAGSSAGVHLLTPGIASTYQRELKARTRRPGVQSTLAQPQSGTCTASAALMEVQIEDFNKSPDLSGEIFGPATLVIRYQKREAMLAAAHALEGHLTATVLANPDELNEYRDLLDVLERKVGRVILNGYPTGVEVSHAMVHGGPSPATSDSRFTSVGSRAIVRFARPVCWQGFPQSALPDELKDENPLGILRMVNGQRSREILPS